MSDGFCIIFGGNISFCLNIWTFTPGNAQHKQSNDVTLNLGFQLVF